ncbi:hypothetical protein BMF94_6841 [Rhodotorula taiwanensis]|uniref:Inositol polyphosphate-related phosphatase domain-containing protein n=1 Tax=Rhodotorula taiwanensis TaxID=741276 RepID=A0A2S5B0G2_9BASI|nr:hypothetical protein BMF94_6841 [Rhodotorula taiwanensis]
MVDVSGDLVASATDNFVEVRSISTGRAVRESVLATETVISVCFAHDGRSLWIGTVEGSLQQYDVSPLRENAAKWVKLPVLGYRPDAHEAPVILIQRLRDGEMLTMDESGRLVIWQADANKGLPASLHSHSRTLSIPPRPCWSAILYGQLCAGWSPQSEGGSPATGSVRTFDIAGKVAVEHPAGATEWPLDKLGAISAGCAVPLHPGWVFLGHSSGHVSVWSTEKKAMLDVKRISGNKITAMVGPSRHLWVGDASGLVEVIDVFSPRNWRVLKRFEAHPGAITKMGVDAQTLWLFKEAPLKVPTYRRHHCASGLSVGTYCQDCASGMAFFVMIGSVSRALRAPCRWTNHGTPLAEALDDELPSYSDRSELKLGVFTWNVDGQPPDLLQSNAANREVLSAFVRSLDAPDMLVFNLQEVIDLSDLTLAARTFLFATKSHDVTGRYRHWRRTLLDAIASALPSGVPFRYTECKLVGLYQFVWWRTDTGYAISALDSAAFKAGFGETYGNKGCCATAITVDDTSFAFVDAHLTAGEGRQAARTLELTRYFDANPVFRRKATADGIGFRRGGDGTRLLDMETVFFCGDLNFRVNLPRAEVLRTLATSPHAVSDLLPHDELTALKHDDPSFRLRDFREAKIDFEPTYKYDHFSTRYDTSEKQRIPSWCDRVLWHNDKEDDVRCLFYRRYEADMSDHRPVGAAFVVRAYKINRLKQQEAHRNVLREWTNMEEGLILTARGYYPPLS